MHRGFPPHACEPDRPQSEPQNRPALRLSRAPHALIPEAGLEHRLAQTGPLFAEYVDTICLDPLSSRFSRTEFIDIRIAMAQNFIPYLINSTEFNSIYRR